MVVCLYLFFQFLARVKKLKNCMTLVNRMCNKGGRGIKKSKKLCDVIYEQSHGKYDSHNIVYHLHMTWFGIFKSQQAYTFNPETAQLVVLRIEATLCMKFIWGDVRYLWVNERALEIPFFCQNHVRFSKFQVWLSLLRNCLGCQPSKNEIQ